MPQENRKNLDRRANLDNQKADRRSGILRRITPDRRKKKFSGSTGDGEKRILKDRRVIPDLRMDGNRRFAEIRRRYSDRVNYSYHH